MLLKRTASGITLTLLLMGMLALAFNIQPAKASGTIYIRADGSIEPDTAPISSVDNVTYNFTWNINDSIVVERDNIVVDGAGYTLEGTPKPNSKGINLSGRSNVTIKNMRITSFWIGIMLEVSSSNTISGNNVTNNEASIKIKASSYNNVSGNSIANNRYGIAFLNSSNYNTISGNNIMANNCLGIGFEKSSNNTIKGNNITNNGVPGVYLALASSHNKFYHNNLIDNSEQVTCTSDIRCFWDNGYPSGGNYWSDYNGADSDGDSLGDTPYIIDGNNQDNYPLMHPYGPVCNLNTSLTYTTIQSAIDAPETLNGHSIFVRNGTYYEHVVVDKSLSLIGEDKHSTKIDGSSYGTVVTVTADNVSITGFTIQKSQESGIPTFSGIFMSSNGNNISNTILTNNTSGFYLHNSSYNMIACNTISNNNQAILLDHSSSNNILTGNNASHNNRGLQFMYSCHYNTISNNTVSNNDDYGIIIEYECHNNSLVCNTISDNNDTGLLLVTSNNNTIFHNNFINNTQQIYIVDSANFWDNGCEGNYWSNYDGTDLDSDGIGDTELPWEGVDSHPLMNLYWNPADVDHDLNVDLYDAIRLLKGYGSKLGDENYNPHCDIAEPYGQIDLYDAVLLLVNYGKKYD